MVNGFNGNNQLKSNLKQAYLYKVSANVMQRPYGRVKGKFTTSNSVNIDVREFEDAPPAIIVQADVSASGYLPTGEQVFTAECGVEGLFEAEGTPEELAKYIDDLDTAYSLAAQIFPLTVQHLNNLVANLGLGNITIQNGLSRENFKKISSDEPIED